MPEDEFEPGGGGPGGMFPPWWFDPKDIAEQGPSYDLERQAEAEQNIELVTPETVDQLAEGEPIPGLGDPVDIMIREFGLIAADPDLLAALARENPDNPMLQDIVPDDVLNFLRELKKWEASGEIPELYLADKFDWEHVTDFVTFFAYCFATWVGQFNLEKWAKAIGYVLTFNQVEASGALFFVQTSLEAKPWLKTFDPNDKSTWEKWMTSPGTWGGVMESYNTYQQQLQILENAITGQIREADKMVAAVDSIGAHAITLGILLVLGKILGPKVGTFVVTNVAAIATWYSTYSMKKNINGINEKMDAVVKELKAIKSAQEQSNKKKEPTVEQTKEEPEPTPEPKPEPDDKDKTTDFISLKDAQALLDAAGITGVDVNSLLDPSGNISLSKLIALIAAIKAIPKGGDGGNVKTPVPTPTPSTPRERGIGDLGTSGTGSKAETSKENECVKLIQAHLAKYGNSKVKLIPKRCRAMFQTMASNLGGPISPDSTSSLKDLTRRSR